MLIETPRLSLRPLARLDEDEIAALPFTRPAIRDAAIARLRAGAIEHEWKEHGYGSFAVLDRATDTFLGRVGLKYWPEFDEVELGWILRQDAWGQGYATEAARAVIDWGFQALDFPYLTAIIRPDNSSSIRVAERLGLTMLRTDTLLGDRVIVYAVSRGPGPGPVKHAQPI